MASRAVLDGYQQQVGPGGTPALPFVSPGNYSAVGEAVAQFGEHELERDRQKEATDAAVKIAQAQADHDVAVKQAEEQAGPGGAGLADAVTTDWNARKQTILDGIRSRQVRQNVEAQLAEIGAASRSHAQILEIAKTSAKTVTDYTGARDIQGNRLQSTDDPAQLRIAIEGDDRTRATLNLPDDKKEELGRETRGVLAKSYIAGQIERNPAAILGSMSGGAFDAYLKPDEKEAAINSAQVEIRRREAQARADASQAKALEREQLSTLEVQLKTGRGTYQQWQDLEKRWTAIGDTSKAAEAHAQGVEYMAAERYRGAPPAERDARITELAAKPQLSADEGAELRGLQGQKKYVDGLSTLDRMTYATGRSVAPLDISDDDSISQRVNLLEASKRFGGVADPFQPAEAEQVKELIAKGGTDQRIAAAHVIARLGKYAGRALDQVAGNDATFRAAATLLPLKNGEQLMRDALAGPEALKAHPQLLTPGKDEAGQPLSPKPSDIFTAATARATAALPPAFVDAVRTNAQNIYLSTAQKSGWTMFHDGEYQRAIRTALGGVWTDRGWVGGLGSWAGEQIVLPRGMSQQGFETRMARANGAEWRAAANGTPWTSGGPMKLGELRSLTPVMVRDGVYRLRQGNSYIVTKEGRQFEFDARRLPGIAHAAAAATPQPSASDALHDTWQTAHK